MPACAKQSFAGCLRKDHLRGAIAAALRKRGHSVRKYVGRSQFGCDLAICGASGEHLSLGVLLNGDTAAATDVGERYICRRTVLRSFG